MELMFQQENFYCISLEKNVDNIYPNTYNYEKRRDDRQVS